MIRFGSASVRRDELKNVKARSLINNFETGDVKRGDDEPVPTTPKSPEVEDETARPGTTKKLLAAFQQFDQPQERKEPVRTPSKKGPPKRFSWMNGANEGEQKPENNTEVNKPAQANQEKQSESSKKQGAVVQPKPVETKQEIKVAKNEPEIAKPSKEPSKEEPVKETIEQTEQPKEASKPVEPQSEENKKADAAKDESKNVQPPNKEAEQSKEPIKTEPPKEEPKKAEPPKEEPKKAEPPKEEPKKAEPPKEEPSKAESPKEELKKAEPPKEEPKEVDPPKEEPKKAEPTKEEPKKAEPPKEEPKKAEPPKKEPKKSEPSKNEPSKVEPSEEPKKAEPPKEELKSKGINKEESEVEPPKEEDKKAEPTTDEKKAVEPPKKEQKEVVQPKEEPKSVQPQKEGVDKKGGEIQQPKEDPKPIDSQKEESKGESLKEVPQTEEPSSKGENLAEPSKATDPPREKQKPTQPVQEQVPPKIELTPAEQQMDVTSANATIDQQSIMVQNHTTSTSAFSSEELVTLKESNQVVVSSQVVTTSKVTTITPNNETTEKVVNKTEKVQSVTDVKKPAESFSSQKKKKVLLVYVGLPKKTFDAAFRDATVASLEAQGCEVVVSDLMKMEFNPVLSIKDIGDIDRDEFDYVDDLASAFKEGKIAEDICVEQEKVKAADLVILHYQTLLHEVPAILMGWLQRVLMPNFAFDVRENQVFDNGLLKGKKAMVSVTYLGPGSAWSERGILGDINVSLWPIQNGILRFCGFDVLKPELTHNVHMMGPKDRESTLASWENRVKGIWSEEAIKFIPSKDFDNKDGWLLTDRALSRLMFSPGAPTTGQHLGRPLPLTSQTKL